MKMTRGFILLALASILAIPMCKAHGGENEISKTVKVLTCNGATLVFDFVQSPSEARGTETILTVSRDNRSTVLRYDMNIDFIGAECRTRKSDPKSQLIIFQAYCGGSGCADLANFGIINANDLRVLLVPNDWNKKDAERILGEKVVKPIPTNDMYSIENRRKLSDLH